MTDQAFKRSAYVNPTCKSPSKMPFHIIQRSKPIEEVQQNLCILDSVSLIPEELNAVYDPLRTAPSSLKDMEVTRFHAESQPVA